MRLCALRGSSPTSLSFPGKDVSGTGGHRYFGGHGLGRWGGGLGHVNHVNIDVHHSFALVAKFIRNEWRAGTVLVSPVNPSPPQDVLRERTTPPRNTSSRAFRKVTKLRLCDFLQEFRLSTESTTQMRRSSGAGRL